MEAITVVIMVMTMITMGRRGDSKEHIAPIHQDRDDNIADDDFRGYGDVEVMIMMR